MNVWILAALTHQPYRSLVRLAFIHLIRILSPLINSHLLHQPPFTLSHAEC